MLIFTRDTNESLIIDDDVRVTVLAINDYPVKFDIDAPIDVSVHRKEVYKRIKEEGKNN